ncbi:MAG: hypothetical protein DI589_05800 [Shinella sp.]|nr:MAG: hypothetical protein DI589_05800 [Shinella sp.]
MKTKIEIDLIDQMDNFRQSIALLLMATHALRPDEERKALDYHIYGMSLRFDEIYDCVNDALVGRT